MQRHDSDPVLSKKALMEGFSLDSKILPKQHSEPGPMIHERKPKYLIEGPGKMASNLKWISLILLIQWCYEFKDSPNSLISRIYWLSEFVDSSNSLIVRIQISSLIWISEESYFKVTCGTLEGRLIWHKFVCPGINVRCIRLDSKHELITPKELVKEAGKQTLKDWKRAIRINTKMLRYVLFQ